MSAIVAVLPAGPSEEPHTETQSSRGHSSVHLCTASLECGRVAGRTTRYSLPPSLPHSLTHSLILPHSLTHTPSLTHSHSLPHSLTTHSSGDVDGLLTATSFSTLPVGASSDPVQLVTSLFSTHTLLLSPGSWMCPLSGPIYLKRQSLTMRPNRE